MNHQEPEIKALKTWLTKHGQKNRDIEPSPHDQKTKKQHPTIPGPDKGVKMNNSKRIDRLEKQVEDLKWAILEVAESAPANPYKGEYLHDLLEERYFKEAEE